MSEKFRFELRADLSVVIGENKIIASSIGANGEAVLLTVAPQFENIAFGREERKGATFPLSKPKSNYPATFVRFNGREVLQKAELAEVALAFPFVQPLPNDKLLLVGARCHYRDGNPEQNAIVFNSQGQELRRFVLGDGIKDVFTTVEGLIWVSYFDEGIFGSFGWDKPIGTSGIVCFDSKGKTLWEFSPPPKFDSISDCYALNVARDSVWACYYTDFPLVKIDSEKRVQGWKNEIGGASALAVNETRALLWGGYRESRSRCVVQEIRDDSLIQPRQIDLKAPNGAKLTGATIFGRDSTLHAFADNSWLTFDIERIT